MIGNKPVLKTFESSSFWSLYNLLSALGGGYAAAARSAAAYPNWVSYPLVALDKGYFTGLQLMQPGVGVGAGQHSA